MQTLLVNARFLDRPTTGVDRVAHELVSALANHPDFSETYKIQMMRAPRHEPMPNMLNHIRTGIWEQITLGFKRRDLQLLSPCNTGPALRQNHILFMHDAQVFSQPQSYSLAFRSRYKILLPLLGRAAKCIIVPSEHTKADLQRFKVASGAKVKVVPNGADHILRPRADPAILRRNLLEPGKYFLSIGSMAKHKNLEMLIRASEARRVRDVPLVIAGGMDANVFKTSGIGSSSSVKLLGRVSDPELRSLYENATALVFPSKTEGFGLPPAEAMFCGCPVISSTGGALPEVCGMASVQVDPADTQGWASAMERLTKNLKLRAELSRLGREHVKELTWHAAAGRFLTVLDQLPLDYGAKSSWGRKGDLIGRSTQDNAG